MRKLIPILLSAVLLATGMLYAQVQTYTTFDWVKFREHIVLDSGVYFDKLRIGTGATFGIGAIGTDELGVEGDAEIDGSVYLHGQVTLGNATTDTVWGVGVISAAANVVLAEDVNLGDAVGDIITPVGYFTYLRIGTGTTFGQISAVDTDELGVEGDAEIDGEAWFDGQTNLGDATTDTVFVGGVIEAAANVVLEEDINLGDAIEDVITPVGYFTHLRIGTGATFSNISTVDTDELGVEGEVEIDGEAWLNGQINLGDATTDTVFVGGVVEAAANVVFEENVNLGDAVGDVITPVGYLTYVRIGTGATFSNISTVDADELGVEGEVEIDGETWLNGQVNLGDTSADTLFITAITLATGNANYRNIVIADTYSLDASIATLDTLDDSGDGDIHVADGMIFAVGFAVSDDQVGDFNKATMDTLDDSGDNGIYVASEILRMKPHTITAGDSVLGNMFFDTADSLLKIWSGAQWDTLKYGG